MKFVGQDVEGERMEIMEQYHPEYISRPLAPSPPYFGLILASIGKLQSFLSHSAQSNSPTRITSDAEDSDEEISSMVKNLSYSQTVKSAGMNIEDSWVFFKTVHFQY